MSKEDKRREVERLMSLSSAVNEGAVESPINLTGGMRCVSSCPHCKEEIEASLRDHPWQVGACPHCKKIVFYVSVPFHACGAMGPLIMGYGSIEFYFLTEHLGDRFIEIRPSKERFSKFQNPDA